MAQVKFTYALKRFYPDLATIEMEGSKVQDILDQLEVKFPGINSYLVDDQGALRQHVNIFVDGSLIKDKTHMSDEIDDKSEVYIMQALSGG